MSIWSRFCLASLIIWAVYILHPEFPGLGNVSVLFGLALGYIFLGDEI